jgi:hypothetical protein
MIIEILLLCIAFPAAATGIMACVFVAGSVGSLFCAIFGGIMVIMTAITMAVVEIRRNWKISSPEEQHKIVVGIWSFMGLIALFLAIMALDIVKKNREKAAVKKLAESFGREMTPEVMEEVVREVWVAPRRSSRLMATKKL